MDAAKEAATETASSKLIVGPVGGKRVEHQAVARVVRVLELLDDRAAGAGPAFPVDLAQRVARAVVAQADEFAGVADRVGVGLAGDLESGTAGQLDRRQRKAARQDQQGGRRGLDLHAFLKQAERIRQQHPQVVKLDHPAAQWGEFDENTCLLSRASAGFHPARHPSVNRRFRSISHCQRK